LQILSHILHPHPTLPLIPVPAVPFAGILIMSPWVILESTAPSFVYSDKDTLSSKPLLAWGRMYRQGNALSDGMGEPGGYWSEPLKAPMEWWRDVAKVTRHVMVTYGEFEAFRDDNAAFAKKLKESVGPKVDVTSVEEPRGIHIGPTSDANSERFSSELTKIISGWVHDRVLS
jgi:acetyl esterase/lipase